MWRLLLLGVLLAFPVVSDAAVTISEVAWMGDSTSANHEWIELYNDGAAVEVNSWTLSDGMNLSITLSGTVPAGAFVVLERTSDESAPGAAFLIYAGALVNTGATLTLRRADGAIEDQVAGGENWSGIGGDNVTKETAQLTTAGWVTAIPTPGDVATTHRVETDKEEVSAIKTSSSGGTARVSSRTPQPPLLHKEPSVPSVTVVGPKTVLVGQEVSYEALVEDIGPTIVRAMSYQWNFGDATVGTGKEVSHQYLYPGEYALVVRAEYKEYVAEGYVPIVVLPYNLSLSVGGDGVIHVHNDSRYTVDVSGFVVATNRAAFRLPALSYLEPSATLRIPPDRLRYVDGAIALLDTLDASVAMYPPATVTDTPLPAVLGATATYFAPDAVVPGVGEDGAVPDETVMSDTEIRPAIQSEVGEVPASTIPWAVYGAWLLVVGIAGAALVVRKPGPALVPVYQDDAVDEVPFR